MSQISILGCGWLGLPLAEALIRSGFSVKGSTTSTSKLPPLENKRIDAFVLSLEADAIEGDLSNFLKGSEILIIDIPPRFHFSKKMEKLVPFLEQSGIQKLLLVSSISVYDQSKGWLTEADIPNPKSEKSHQLFTAENLLQQHPNFKTTVLRFGGLIGAERHPVKYLSGAENIENPEAAINLIHQQDCIGIIEQIIAQNVWGETFNAVTPWHPSRAEYYTQKAISLALQPPQFDYSKPSVGKIISAQKLQNLLNYTFIFPQL